MTESELYQQLNKLEEKLEKAYDEESKYAGIARDIQTQIDATNRSLEIYNLAAMREIALLCLKHEQEIRKAFEEKKYKIVSTTIELSNRQSVYMLGLVTKGFTQQYGVNLSKLYFTDTVTMFEKEPKKILHSVLDKYL